MTATQAPTPGPLSGDDVKMLVKGDWLLPTLSGATPKQFDHVGATVRDTPLLFFVDGGSCLASVANFIGRPDADGWMTWSGGENPAPGQMVDFDDGTVSLVNCLSDIFDVWEKPGRFRLSPTAPVENPDEPCAPENAIDWPTAPVEASGSEREAVARTMLRDAFIAGRVVSTATTGSQDQRDAEAYAAERDLSSLSAPVAETAGDLRLILSALRPQPSGETQEALDRMKMAAHVYEDDEMAADCATLEALLSARPLALGGQQGDSETLRVLLDNLVIAQTMSKDIRQKATDEARSYLYDRRHTPARAEAQDEGAAGEAVAWDYCPECGSREICHEEGDHKQCGHCGQEWFSDIDYSGVVQNNLARLYAHPSPTPAAAQSPEAWTPGRHLHALRMAFFNGGGWAEAPEWTDYDDAGHAKWEDFAKSVAAIDHSSTTPAADADRVREVGAAIQRVDAVSLGSAVLEVYGSESFAHPQETFRGDLRAILAALKSEGK